MAETVFVALGSNQGSREAQLQAAVTALARHGAIEVEAVSPIFETCPVGGPPQPPYLNGVVALRTELPPLDLLAVLLAIEREQGRIRPASGERNQPRGLDLDLLLYGDRCISLPGLVVPHPRLHQRAFVLEPLSVLAPELRHPVLGETIGRLAEAVRDPQAVQLHPARISALT